MGLTAAQKLEVKRAIIDDFLIASSIRVNETAQYDDVLSEAIDAVDVWFDANMGGYNAALPQIFRKDASLRLKAALLFYVVRRRIQSL